MRYRHIKEGIRMGAKDLASPPKKKYTMGFEVEVAVDNYSVPDEFSSDDYDAAYDTNDYDDAYDRYLEEYGYPMLSDWVSENYREIDFSDMTPRYGWVGKPFNDYMDELPDGDKIRNTLQDLVKEIFENRTRFNTDVTKNTDGIGEKYYKIIIELMEKFGPIPYAIEMVSDFHDVETNKSQPHYDPYHIRHNLELILKKLNGQVNIYLAAKIEDSYNAVYNENGDEVELREIDNLETVLELFTEDVNEFRDLVEREYTRWADEIVSDGVNNTITDMRSASSSSLGSIKNVVDEWMGVSSEVHGTNFNGWNIVPDGTTGVDAEITSPIEGIDQSLSSMKAIFEMIENNSEWISTTRNCGLHINIGSWTPEEVKKIDWLKFLMIIRADKILKDFSRDYNTFAKDRLPEIINALKGTHDNLSTYFKNLEDLNKIVLRDAQKFSAINFLKLDKSNPHIEIRAFGNTDYHLKFDLIKNYTLKVIRALEIASDPNAYKNEYINMLYKTFGLQALGDKNQSKKDSSIYERSHDIQEFYRLWDGKFGRTIGQIHNFSSYFKSMISDYLYHATNKDGSAQNEKGKGYLTEINNEISKEMVKSFIKVLDLVKNTKDSGFLRTEFHPAYQKELKNYPKIDYMIKRIME